MSRAAYACGACWVCNQRISAAGAAYVSHMRKHVREGKVIEIPPDGYRGVFTYERVKKTDR